jgi:hypothetical protein
MIAQYLAVQFENHPLSTSGFTMAEVLEAMKAWNQARICKICAIANDMFEILVQNAVSHYGS